MNIRSCYIMFNIKFQEGFLGSSDVPTGKSKQRVFLNTVHRSYGWHIKDERQGSFLYPEQHDFLLVLFSNTWFP